MVLLSEKIYINIYEKNISFLGFLILKSKKKIIGFFSAPRNFLIFFLFKDLIESCAGIFLQSNGVVNDATSLWQIYELVETTTLINNAAVWGSA